MLNTKTRINILTDITLAMHKMWGIDGDRCGDVISCTNGTLWITQEDDLRDYIITAGQSFWITKPGTVVVQALENSQFKYNLNELQSHVETNVQPRHRLPGTRLGNHLR